MLDGVSLLVKPGEVVALLGHNGAGKSTLLKAVSGLLPTWSGEIRLDGQRLEGVTPGRLRRAGLAFVPQGNRVFTELTVAENLAMGALILPTGTERRAALDRLLKILPGLDPLLKRRAGTLSGGEKQMAALGVGLICSPRLLLLDEPSLGLAPNRVPEILSLVRRLTEGGIVSAVLAEQRVREALRVADQAVVLRNGRVTFSGPAGELRDEAKLQAVFL